MAEVVQCPICNGTGKSDNDSRCVLCDGLGLATLLAGDSNDTENKHTASSTVWHQIWRYKC